MLATPNLGDVYSRIAFLFGYIPFPLRSQHVQSGVACKDKDHGRGHKSVFTYRAIKELLDYYGFQIIGSSGYPYVESFYHQLGLKAERTGTGVREAAESIWRDPADFAE